MQRTPLPSFPEPLSPSLSRLISDSPVYDSSCSDLARVYFIDRDSGLYLKTAAPGALQDETILTRYFHGLHFGPEAIYSESGARDYLLTRRIPGEDCIHPMYLDNPDRLCDTLAAILRLLHDTSPEGCPITHPVPTLPDWTDNEIRLHYKPRRFLGAVPFRTAEDAWDTLSHMLPGLQPEVLIHGDYCLPNVILKDWQFSGLIDLGGGGLGSRYLDLFWTLWSLCYNLKSDRYTDRFLDAYGRDRFDPKLLLAQAALEGFDFP